MSDLNSRDIERALDAERLALAQSLVALRERLSPARLAAEGKAALWSQAGPLVSKIDSAVRARPVAAAVAGVALAALVLGRRRSDTESDMAPALAGTRFEALSRWEDEGGPPAPEPVDPGEDWLTEAVTSRTQATRLLAQIDDAARRGLAPAAELAAHRADVAAALARDTAAALGRGLGDLTGAARDRAIRARERVYLARLGLSARGAAMVRDRPLVAGLGMAAAGAALACLFPPTEAEDRLLGDARDDLLEDLKRTARDEAVKASDLARTLTSALKSDMSRIGGIAAPRPEGPGAWRH